MNVVTSLLGLVIVSHLSPKGSGRFTLSFELWPEVTAFGHYLYCLCIDEVFLYAAFCRSLASSISEDIPEIHLLIDEARC
jgi:hypothetical protein